MKITLRDIINIQSSYSKLLEQVYLPIKIRYTLSKDGRKIQSELEELQKMRDSLIMKYGSKQKDGSTAILPGSPNLASYEVDMSDLLDIEIDLLTDQIDVELFMRDDCTLSAKDLLILDKLIIDKSDEKDIENKNSKSEDKLEGKE